MDPVINESIKEFFDKHHGILDSGDMQTVVKFAQHLADSKKIFTIDEVGRMIYEFIGQYYLEGKYNHCKHTIEAIQEYKQEITK